MSWLNPVRLITGSGNFSILKTDWNLHLSLTEGERIQVENFSTSESSLDAEVLSGGTTT
jgi:hypothetical protein